MSSVPMASSLAQPRTVDLRSLLGGTAASGQTLERKVPLGDSFARGGTASPLPQPGAGATHAGNPALGEELRARVRDAHLGGPRDAPRAQAVAKTGPTPELKSEAEIRELFNTKVFPGVKKGLTASGLSVNETNCDKAAGMTKHALEKLGVGGVEVKNGVNHTYCEVTTKEGKKLILDPTASQFFKDGTAIDTKLQKKGFVGTRDELKGTIGDNIEHWKFSSGIQIPQAVADAARGKTVPGISQPDAAPMVNDATKEAGATYFADGRQTMGDLAQSAERQAQWYAQGNLDKPFKTALTGEDIGPKLKTAYETLDRFLL